MNDITELKQYAEVHARAQGILRYQQLLARIDTDDDAKWSSWTRQWSAAGDMFKLRGRHLQAARYYTMARFPYVNGPLRQAALDNTVLSFERWAARRSDIERVEIELKRTKVRTWAAGLDPAKPKPLLVVMGGIVSTKEQWAPVLARVASLGMAGVVAEMPGVGENELRYDEDSWRILPGILDALADRADVSQTYALTLSFSGHLALRAASEDRRIRGIVTAGAPVNGFFTDTEWQRGVPEITMDTLAHLTRVERAELPEFIRGWALSADQLAEIDVPVSYLLSSRDEIIPPGETQLLRGALRGGLEILENDDVHGSPAHTAESRLWTILEVQRMRGVRNGQTAVLGGMLRMARSRSRRAARKRS